MGARLDQAGSERNGGHGVWEGVIELAQLTQIQDGSSPLGALQAMSLAVSRAPKLAAGLNGVLDGLLRLTQAEIGAVHLVQEGTGDLYLVASRGLSERFRSEECRIPHGVCVCGRAVVDDEPVVVDDLASSPDLERSACVEERIGSLVAVPCRSRGRTFGLVTLYARTVGAFARIDRVLLRAIGIHLGAAIDNAEWIASAREQAVADERKVLAGELHDGVAQSLAYLNMQVTRVQEMLARGAADGAGEAMASVREGIQSAYDDVRRLLADFRLAPSQAGTFGDALKKQTEAFAKRSGILVHLAGEDHASALSFAQQAEVFRIIQEALANVQKHARASTVWVTCEQQDGRCLLCVKDDGAGFDAESLGNGDGSHVGTMMIRERAARLRGLVTIDSQPGGGTAVSVSVPLLLAEEGSL